MFKTLPFTKITALLLILCLSLSFFACSDDEGGGLFSKPSYVGEWTQIPDESSIYNEGKISITEDEITITIEGDVFSTDYTVSSDDYYTYLECAIEGDSIVLVVLNKDMLAICTDEGYNNSDFVGTTPNGVKFNAEIRGNILFKSGAYTTDVPESLRSSKYFSTYDTLYYYENADVIFPFDSTGHSDGIFAVTTANEIEYAEGITLVNMDPSGRTWIPVNGNFVIIDNK